MLERLPVPLQTRPLSERRVHSLTGCPTRTPMPISTNMLQHLLGFITIISRSREQVLSSIMPVNREYIWRYPPGHLALATSDVDTVFVFFPALNSNHSFSAIQASRHSFFLRHQRCFQLSDFTTSVFIKQRFFPPHSSPLLNQQHSFACS